MFQDNIVTKHSQEMVKHDKLILLRSPNVKTKGTVYLLHQSKTHMMRSTTIALQRLFIL